MKDVEHTKDPVSMQHDYAQPTGFADARCGTVGILLKAGIETGGRGIARGAAFTLGLSIAQTEAAG